MAENTLEVRIKQRYDTESNWSTNNPVLLKGEIAISSDKNGRYKVGDGTSTWSALSYNKADPTTHTHTKSQITDFPTSLKNPNALTIQGNGTTLTNGTYDGSAAKTVNITPSSIGASPAAGSTSLSKLAATVTLGDGGAGTILQNSSTYQQKIEILDNSTSGDAVFKFSQSTDSGSNFSNLMEIRDDGNVVANKFTGSLSGNANTATTATKLATARTIALTGSVTGSGTFDGSGNLSIATTTNHTHNYLVEKGTNTISSTTDDTTSNWGKQLSSVHWYTTSGCLTDQPSQYGYLLNIGRNSEVHQIWMTQNSGNMAHRGGNASGWGGTWRTLLDSTNYNSYAATKSHTHTKSQITDFPTSLKNPYVIDINGTTYDGSGKIDVDLLPFVVGTQTAATGSWTGNASTISALFDGLTIRYWLPYNGSGNATLNLTLADGSTTGAINCYYSGASRLTTHYPAGNIITLTYRKDVSIAGSSTKYTGWWADANYDSGDTHLRVYREATTSTYNADYPLLVSRTLSSGISSTEGGYTSIYGMVGSNDTTPTVNVQTGEIKAAKFTGALNGNASTATSATSATKLSTARTIRTNLASTSTASFDGSANITPGVTGTLPVANGGTGQTTANAAANNFINSLDAGSATPQDADYYVSQYVGGGTTTTTYHRRPMSALWEYVKSKISSVLGLTSSSYGGNAATATKLGTSTVGSSTKPIYLSSGTATASSSTVGSTDTPVYMNSGTITSTGKKFSDYLPLTGGNISGGSLSINTNSGTNPLKITRTGSASEQTSIYQDDSTLYFDMTNDETSASVKFKMSATDTENSDGSNASSNTITFASNSSGSSITANSFIGNASTATALTTSAGSATQPVYFSSGKPVATTYTLGKSVPSNAVFTDTHYTTGLKVGASSTATANAAATNGNVYLNALDNTTVRDSHKIVGSGATTVTSDANGVITISSTDNNTTYTAGTGLTLSGTQFKHSNSITAGTAQGDSSKTLSWSGTFTIPTVSYDAQGHVTGKGTTTMTMPANPNTDTKNTAGSTDTSSKIYLVGATSQAANPQTYSDNQVYATDGQLDANKVRVAEKVTLQYNSSTESLDFVFS